MINELSTAGNLNELMGNTPAPAPVSMSGAIGEDGSITSSDPAPKDANITGGQENLGKAEFLQLLITSLQHQDPLDPVKNEAFISQIAEFSALENSMNMTNSLDKLATNIQGLIDNQNSSYETVSNVSAASLLGNRARIESDVHLSGKETIVDVHINDGESSSVILIFNDEGDVIAELNRNADGNMLNQGDHTLPWDGTTVDGSKAGPGKYTAKVTDMSGLRDTGYIYTEDTVTGITYDSNGMLLEVDGRKLPFDKVIELLSNEKDAKENG